VLPVIAVQIAPGEPAPQLEEYLLRACSAGLERATCVSAASAGPSPRAIAVVSWTGPEHASIEVGLASSGEQPGSGAPAWLSRELDFAPGDPELERWRAVGFTIALLAGDSRFWTLPEAPEPPALASALQVPSVPVQSLGEDEAAVQFELRALTGAGLVGGPLRWGAELRLSVPLARTLFITTSADYALAREAPLDIRWFDVSLGLGLNAESLLPGVDGRLRLEALVENVAFSAKNGFLTDRTSAWVPGGVLGADLAWRVGEPWLLSVFMDLFVLDGSTSIASAGESLGASAGAGVLAGAGAGYRF
jgi:hypothetical protein